MYKHEESCLQSDEIYECKYCGYKRGTKYGLGTHIKSVHQDLIKMDLELGLDVSFKSNYSPKNTGLNTPITRLNRESIMMEKAMKHAKNVKCNVKLVKCKILGFIFN